MKFDNKLNNTSMIAKIIYIQIFIQLLWSIWNYLIIQFYINTSIMCTKKCHIKIAHIIIYRGPDRKKKLGFSWMYRSIKIKVTYHFYKSGKPQPNWIVKNLEHPAEESSRKGCEALFIHLKSSLKLTVHTSWSKSQF